MPTNFFLGHTESVLLRNFKLFKNNAISTVERRTANVSTVIPP